MIVFPADLQTILRKSGLCLSLLGLIATTPALARPGDGDPTSLTSRQNYAAPAGAPLSSPPLNSPSWSSPIRDEVGARDLDQSNADRIGLLDFERGGLGAEMWAGSQMDLVQKAMALMPISPSPAMHGLSRRLLLSQATPPSGAVGEKDPSLIQLRAEKLWKLGEVEDMLQLLGMMPAASVTPRLRRLAIDAELFAGQDGAACASVDSLIDKTELGSYPQQLKIYCQIVSSKNGEAQLGLDLLREQSLDAPLFFAAGDILIGAGTAQIDDAWWKGVDMLTLALVRRAAIQIPLIAATSIQSLPLLRMIASTPSASLDARLVAMEIACGAGAEEIEDLQNLYMSVEFSATDLEKPLRADNPRARALLYRAVVSQKQPVVKTELIANALVAKGYDYLLMARLLAQEISSFVPSADFSSFAAIFARASFAAGLYDQAQRWADFANRQASGDLAEQAKSLWILRTLTADDGEGNIPTQATTQWRKSRSDLSFEAHKRRLSVGFSLLSAFGRKVPPQEWLLLFDGVAQPAPTSSNPAIFHGLRLAAEDLRLGETVLLALASLDGDGLTETAATELYRAIEAIRLIGLDSDARALAIEAAVVNGV